MVGWDGKKAEEVNEEGEEGKREVKEEAKQEVEEGKGEVREEVCFREEGAS